MERISWALTAALALGACSDKGGDDTGTNSTNNQPSCDITVSDSTVPSDGQTDFYYRAAIEFHLSDADSTAEVSLTDSSGAAVDGTQSTSDDGKIVYFAPSSPLTPDSDYTASISLCNGASNPSLSFHTSSLGEPLTADLTGNTYVLDLQDARFIDPPGVADLLLSQLDNNILVGVTSYDSASLQMIGALSVEGGTDQDFCNPTIEFPEADFSEQPYFSVGPQDTTLSVAGYDITISQLQISGTFSADGSYFGGGVLAGELDARVLAPLLGDVIGSTDPDYICQLVAGFGVTCGPCSSDGESYCINVLADQITAQATGSSLVAVDQEDCNQMCADSCDNTECTEAQSWEICGGGGGTDTGF